MTIDTSKFPKIKLPSALYYTSVECPYCGGKKVIKKSKGRVQCKECGRTFTTKRKRQYFPPGV